MSEHVHKIPENNTKTIKNLCIRHCEQSPNKDYCYSNCIILNDFYECVTRTKDMRRCQQILLEAKSDLPK